jgi:hypothetical protein
MSTPSTTTRGAVALVSTTLRPVLRPVLLAAVVVPLVWTRDDHTIGAYGRGGGCTDARLEIVEQGPERVVLRVVQFSTGPGPCTRELIYPPLEATLDGPLGERPVVLTGQVP